MASLLDHDARTNSHRPHSKPSNPGQCPRTQLREALPAPAPSRVAARRLEFQNHGPYTRPFHIVSRSTTSRGHHSTMSIAATRRDQLRKPISGSGKGDRRVDHNTDNSQLPTLHVSYFRRGGQCSDDAEYRIPNARRISGRGRALLWSQYAEFGLMEPAVWLKRPSAKSRTAL